MYVNAICYVGVLDITITLFAALNVMAMKVDWMIVIYGSVLSILTSALGVLSSFLAVSS